MGNENSVGQDTVAPRQEQTDVRHRPVDPEYRPAVERRPFQGPTIEKVAYDFDIWDHYHEVCEVGQDFLDGINTSQFRADHLETEEVVGIFEIEAPAAGGMKNDLRCLLTSLPNGHPNLVSVRRIYETPDGFFLIVEDVKPGLSQLTKEPRETADLFDFVVDLSEQGQQIHMQDLATVIHQVASALHFLHEHNIVGTRVRLEDVLIQDIDITDPKATSWIPLQNATISPAGLSTVLSVDIYRIRSTVSDSDGGIALVLKTGDHAGDVACTIPDTTAPVRETVADILGVPLQTVLAVLCGGVDITEGSFQENGVDDGASCSVMMGVSPQVGRALLSGAWLNPSRLYSDQQNDPEAPQGIYVLAPEHMIGRQKASRPGDVWCLGVLAYTCAVANLPFGAPHQQQFKSSIMRGEYKPMHGPKWANVDEECKVLIRRMLMVDPELRITLQELLEDPWLKRMVEPAHVY